MHNSVATLCFINVREKFIITLCRCYLARKECGCLTDPHSGNVSGVSLGGVNTSDPNFTPQPLPPFTLPLASGKG